MTCEADDVSACITRDRISISASRNVKMKSAAFHATEIALFFKVRLTEEGDI